MGSEMCIRDSYCPPLAALLRRWVAAERTAGRGAWSSGVRRVRSRAGVCDCTWFKVPIKNTKSESGAERLRLVSMHAGEVSGAVLNLFGTLSSL